MDIKPIRSEKDYEQALNEIERLFDAEPDTPEGENLEVLVILVESYEKEHYSIPLPDPIEAIEYHMERLGLTRKDLEIYVGGPSRVSEILNRKRPLNLRMIRGLSAGLNIPTDVLAQAYELIEPEPEVSAGFSPFWVGVPFLEFRSSDSAQAMSPKKILHKNSIIGMNEFIAKPNYQTVGTASLISNPGLLLIRNAINATEGIIQ
jgi:HTH-type transcriptional regulator / antitoxin HigA